MTPRTIHCFCIATELPGGALVVTPVMVADGIHHAHALGKEIEAQDGLALRTAIYEAYVPPLPQPVRVVQGPPRISAPAAVPPSDPASDSN